MALPERFGCGSEPQRVCSRCRTGLPSTSGDALTRSDGGQFSSQPEATVSSEGAANLLPSEVERQAAQLSEDTTRAFRRSAPAEHAPAEEGESTQTQ